MKKNKRCPYCLSLIVEKKQTMDIVDRIEDIDVDTVYITIEIFECQECGMQYDDMGLFVGPKREKVL